MVDWLAPGASGIVGEGVEEGLEERGGAWRSERRGGGLDEMGGGKGLGLVMLWASEGSGGRGPGNKCVSSPGAGLAMDRKGRQ